MHGGCLGPAAVYCVAAAVWGLWRWLKPVANPAAVDWGLGRCLELVGNSAAVGR